MASRSCKEIEYKHKSLLIAILYQIAKILWRNRCAIKHEDFAIVRGVEGIADGDVNTFMRLVLASCMAFGELFLQSFWDT